MTKEEIYKASDVLNTILDNYLHGGEAAEVVTKFEDELTKSNLTKEESASEDFTKALAECIHQAQGNVFDPLVLAETWKDELIKLAKSEEPVSTKDKLLALSDGRLHLGWIDDAKVVEFEECLMKFHEDMNNIPQGTDNLTRLKDTDGVLHSYSKKLMSMAKEEIKAIKFKAGDKIHLINDDGTGIQTIKKVIRDGYLTTEMLRIKLKDENQWVRVDDNFEGRFEEKEIEL